MCKYLDCDYLDVADVVKIRIEKSCARKNLKPLVVTKYSNRRADNYLYMALCIDTISAMYSVWSYNASTHLLFEGIEVDNLSDAFSILADKLK